MIFRKGKNKEFSLVVYKKDLNIDLNKILFVGNASGIKEYFYVPHFDTSEEHYHIYINFEKGVRTCDVEKLFYKTKCYISPIRYNESALMLLNYYTEGFRLPFESSYSIKVEERRRIDK